MDGCMHACKRGWEASQSADSLPPSLTSTSPPKATTSVRGMMTMVSQKWQLRKRTVPAATYTCPP